MERIEIIRCKFRKGTTHMTLSAVASSSDLIKELSKINEMDTNGRWLATNLGIETVAPRMVKKHLGVKTKPYQPEEWGVVVREGCKILNQNHWFPALDSDYRVAR